MYMVLEYIWEIVVYRDCIKVGYMLFIGLVEFTYVVR